jgi:glycosyltransferase involved in cell wall biosynthesis
MMADTSPPLAILYVGRLPPIWDGTAVHGASLLAEFARRGHRVAALATVTPDLRDALNRFVDSRLRVDVRHLVVPAFTRRSDKIQDNPLHEINQRAYDSKLPELIRDFKPDAVILGFELYVWYVSDLISHYGIPTLLIAHSLISHAIANDSYPKHTKIEFLRRLKHIETIVPARFMSQCYKNNGVEHVHVIGNGVDRDLFRPTPRDAELVKSLGVQSSDIIVLHCSSLASYKRPNDLVRSAKIALQRQPELRYLIVGGDEKPRRQMQEWCREEGVGDRFIFAGFVERERMPRYYSVADIVLSPSELEVQSLVWLEAMACGRALLASDILGAREVIEDGQTALLFQTGDVDDLAAKTLLLAANPAFRTGLGSNAYRRSAAHDFGATADAYLATIRMAIGRRECGGGGASVSHACPLNA